MPQVKKQRYRSGIEGEIVKQLKASGLEHYYEELKIPYTVPSSSHSYTPDFVVTTKSGKEIIIEVKGIWEYSDRYKHLLIRKQMPNLDIRFVFSNSRTKIRKGSRTTYADICNGKGRGIFKNVIWKYADSKIPKSWLDE